MKMNSMHDEAPTDSAQDANIEYPKHEIESAADTLTKAEEIKCKPALHAHALKHLSKKSGAITAAIGSKPKSISDLKSMAKTKAAEEAAETPEKEKLEKIQDND